MQLFTEQEIKVTEEANQVMNSFVEDDVSYLRKILTRKISDTLVSEHLSYPFFERTGKKQRPKFKNTP